MANRSYTISEISELFGLSYRTLRFYEERELLRPRRVGPLRLYSDIDRLRLEVIATGKRLGFSLLEIWALLERRDLSSGAPVETACDLGLTRDDIGAQLEKLTRRRDAVVDSIDELNKLYSKVAP